VDPLTAKSRRSTATRAGISSSPPNRELLRARDEGPLRRTWLEHGVVSVGQALALAGALMRIYGRSYEHAESRYLQHINNYTLFFRLTGAAMPNRLRFVNRWLAVDRHGRPGEQEMQRLQRSLFDRTMDLFRARDYTQRENLRGSHNNATVDEILYHLRAGVATLAAACDSLAMLSALALEIPDSELPDPQRIGFGVQDFRQTLRSHGGQRARIRRWWGWPCSDGAKALSRSDHPLQRAAWIAPHSPRRAAL
jgi:hypothetical protein